MSSGARPHYVFVISDGTGATGEQVVRAALTQFDAEGVVVERIPEVRDPGRIVEAIRIAAERKGTVIFSLVSPEHRHVLLEESWRRHVATIDLLGPILRRLSDELAVSPRAEPGLFHQLDEEYYRRIEAIDFAVKHDDGRSAETLGRADLVLVGVSRTSKTPLSMFLAYRGWRIANVPVVLGIEPPAELFAVSRDRVIALTARPSWLEGVRRVREQRLSQGFPIAYADPDHLKDELAWFRSVADRGGWRVVDVTHKAIEVRASSGAVRARGHAARAALRRSGRISQRGARSHFGEKTSELHTCLCCDLIRPVMLGGRRFPQEGLSCPYAFVEAVSSMCSGERSFPLACCFRSSPRRPRGRRRPRTGPARSSWASTAAWGFRTTTAAARPRSGRCWVAAPDSR